LKFFKLWLLLFVEKPGCNGFKAIHQKAAELQPYCSTYAHKWKEAEASASIGQILAFMK